MRLEMNFWLRYQPMGNRHNYATNGENFTFFGSRSGVVDCDCRKFFSKIRWVFIFVVTFRLFDKAMCAIATKKHKCRFLVLEGNIQNVAAGSALFTVVEITRFIG